MKVGALAAFPLNIYKFMDRPVFSPKEQEKGVCLIKTKTNMLGLFINPYLDNAKKVSEEILDYMFGLKQSRVKEPDKRLVTDLIDVMSIFFVNPKAGTEVDPSRKLNKAKRVRVIENLVQSVKTINTHYNTKRSNTNTLESIDIEQEFYS